MEPAGIAGENLRETILAWTLIEAAKSHLSGRESNDVSSSSVSATRPQRFAGFQIGCGQTNPAASRSGAAVFNMARRLCSPRGGAVPSLPHRRVLGWICDASSDNYASQ